MTDDRQTDDIRKQVQERVEEERAQLTPLPDPGASPPIDSVFVQECLYANELGDGTLFARLFRDRFVFCKNSQEWYEWTGQFWQRDAMNRSLAAVEKVVDCYLNEFRVAGGEIAKIMAGVEEGGDEKVKKLKSRQEALLSRVRQLRADKRRTACLKFAHTIENPVAIKGEEFDDKPMLFPCANGVIDLETGKLNPGRPSDYLSLVSPVEFRSIDEPAPLWEKSLLEIFGGNEKLVAYVQRLYGYAITGLVKEKVFPVLYGRTGWNGRSLIVETISYVMGEMAGPIPSEMLLSQKFSKSSSGPSPDVMSLKGRRMATASEIDEGQRFSASKIKWLTGKDELIGRSPHDKYQTRFHPTHKLFVMTNTQPQAPPNDKAFWERMHLIPFLISFVNRDPQEDYERRAILDLDRQVLQEAPGILAWLVRGCLLWQKYGLKPPKEITEATEQYRRGEDILADYIDACLDRLPVAQETAAALFKRFKEWYCENVGNADKITGTWFGKMMTGKFERGKSNGVIVYRGVQLKREQ